LFNYFWVDIDFNKEVELLLYSESEEKLVVYNTGLHKLAEARLKANRWVLNVSYYLPKNKSNKVFLTSSESGYFLKLTRNKYYYLEFLVYPGIYLLIVLFIGILNRINTLKVKQKESLKQRLITLQLQGIKAQLDPHFTFNTLNSVASLIYLEDREAAYDYMIKFTELLRGMLNDAEKVYRSLEEEINFVTTYLDLEKLRFGEKFNYEIHTGDGVSKKEQVPKLVLQTFAENAIKHGIMPRADGGFLKIIVSRENDYLKLIIEDNGIGRAAAAGQSTSTGKGLKITGEFYDILNQINKRPIKHFIIDLFNEKGSPAGTRVEVLVPVD
jgi:LytS/YehU family sensor histidine kinase